MHLLIAKLILTLTLAVSSLLHAGAAPAPTTAHIGTGAGPLDSPVAHP